MPQILQIEHLSKRFGNLTVLKDISFSVDKGEVISIIGPSGSGKSTLLRCATMLEIPEQGRIAYGNLTLCEDGLYAPKRVCHEIKKRFGLVFQNFNLFPHYSVLKNVMDAPVSVLHQSQKNAKYKALELLAKMELSGKEDAYPCQLSGGQQQRVAIARALAMNPEILFFDEPTSALDPELTNGILKVIRQLATEKMTMVIVTHEIMFARNVSDRIVFMAEGNVVESGPAKELVDHPKQERTINFLSKMNDKG